MTRQTPRRHRLLAAAALVALIVVAAVTVLVVRLAARGPSLAAALPADVTALVEVPSLPALVADLRATRSLDLGAAGPVDAAASEIAAAFDLRTEEARSLVGALESCAVAARRGTGDFEVALVLGFRDRAPVDALLRGPRFRGRGALGRSGLAFALGPRPTDPPPGASLWASLLATGGLDGEDRTVAWFARERILVLGSRTLALGVDGVLHDGAAPLAKSERYLAARGTLESPRAIAFFDPALLGDAGAPAGEGLEHGIVDGSSLVTAAAKPVEAGVLLSVAGRLDPGALPGGRVPVAGASTLPARLPSETVAYAALSTGAGAGGAELARWIDRRLERDDSAFAGALRSALDGLGAGTDPLPLAKILGALGDEGIVALVAARDRKLSLVPGPEAAASLAALGIQRFRDRAVAGRIVTALRSMAADSSLGERFDLAGEPGGFSLRPRAGTTGLPSARVLVVDDALFVGVGAPLLLDRGLESLRTGKGGLADSAAHARARSALPAAPLMLAWIDSGRFLDAAGRPPPGAGEPPGAARALSSWLRSTGDDRTTTALAVSVGGTASAPTYRVDALDLAALVPIAAWTDLDGSDVLPAGWSAPDLALRAPRIAAAPLGVPECDDYLDKLAICIDAMPSSRREPMAVSAAQTREAWRQLASGPGRSALAPICKTARDTLPDYCEAVRPPG